MAAAGEAGAFDAPAALRLAAVVLEVHRVQGFESRREWTRLVRDLTGGGGE